MIPKIIHYCWFGGNPLPPLALKCIESWKKYCPDYEIVRWDESNFDINYNVYAKEAYDTKKWAFVSDYVRLFAIYNYGGIYMDTDVEVIKSLDIFLSEKAFSGFESPEKVPTGIMACEKNHPFFKLLLDDYSERRFILADGRQDLNTNVITITKYCLNAGLKLNNTKQTVAEFTLYPTEYFCPKAGVSAINIITTRNTHVIHHFSASWYTEEQRKHVEKRKKYAKMFGNKFGGNIGGLVYILKQKGIRGVFSKIKEKLFKNKK